MYRSLMRRPLMPLLIACFCMFDLCRYVPVPGELRYNGALCPPVYLYSKLRNIGITYILEFPKDSRTSPAVAR
jgi:hypothetical protein